MVGSSGQLQVTLSHDGERTLVTETGEVDLATLDVLRDALDRCRGHVIVDLSDVAFIDSSGFGVLVIHRTRLEATKGSLSVRNPSEIAKRAFEAVGLESFLD